MKRLRCALVFVIAALAGCARSVPMPDAFPETLGGWHRTGAVRDVPSSQAADALPAKNVEQIRAASYDGPGKLEARVYALSSSAVALDVVQRWTPRADTVFFYRDRFFVVVQWQTADKKALQAFMSALEKRFTAGQPV